MEHVQILCFKSVYPFPSYLITVDRNELFWQHLNQCVQNTVVTASSQILASEQLLIQSQMKIQAASRSIKQANDIADQILIKCRDILTADFLPDIKIPTSTQTQ